MTHFERAHPRGNLTFEDFTVGMMDRRRVTLLALRTAV